MAVPPQIPRNVSTATAGATLFPYDFKVLGKSDIQVEVNGEAREVDVHFTIDGVAQESGGNITFLVPLAGGERVMRRRNMEIKRDTDYQNLGDLRSPTLNNDQDQPIMILQQLNEALGRALMLPASTTATGELPEAEPLRPLVWSLDGTRLENGDTTLTGDMLLRGNLAESESGASLVGYSQAGAGAVARNVQDKLGDVFTAQDFGAAGDASQDDSPSILAALTRAVALGKKSVRFPAGRYRLASKINVAMPLIKGLSIEGEGMGVTEFFVDHAEGSAFEITADAGNYWLDVEQHAAVRFANISIVTGRVDSGTAIKVFGGSEAGRPPQPCVFDHVEFRGSTAFQHSFRVCVDLLDAASAQFIGCRFFGGGPGSSLSDGVWIHASTTGRDPTEFKFTDCDWYFCSRGVYATDHCEGLYFNNPSMVNCDRGIVYTPSIAESGFALNGGHFNNFSGNITLENVFDASITGPIMFHAGENAGFRHISLKSVGSFTIQGHVLRGATTDVGIFVESVAASWGGSIGPGYHRGLGAAVYLDAGSQNVLVAPQKCDSVAERIVNFGTNNSIQPMLYFFNSVIVLTGGGGTESVNLTIPSGVFGSAPRSVVAQVSGPFNLGVNFEAESGSNTATNAVVSVMPRDGGTVPAGSYRILATIYGN